MRTTLGVCTWLLCLAPLGMAQTADTPLKSRAERTNFEETSRYEDVLQFFQDLQRRTDLLRVEMFGKTQEGRAMPLVILADPPVAQPAEARNSGKPVVFIMANIHAGEVEGKEAVQAFARRVVLGDLRPLLDKIIILIAPIYNADGNEKIALLNRTAQNGPIAGVGVRQNAQGFDLNRDYMKMEAPETQALVRLLSRWDPIMTVDLHTTNGSEHAYHLTYSIPLNPTVDPRIIAYSRETMMPAIAKAMLDGHKFRTYYYGNFPREPEPKTWRAFTHEPRIGQNYVGLRNRLTILSEAYSYLDFRRRVEVTEAFVEQICKFVAAHAAEIDKLLKQADADTVKRGRTGEPLQLGVQYEMTPLSQPVEILVGEVTRIKNPKSGREMKAMIEDKVRPVKMTDYGLFVAKRKVPAARAYLLRKEDGLSRSIAKLLQHGLVVEELTEPLTAEVDSFVIDKVMKEKVPFQQHNEVTLQGKFKKETVTYPTGSILVRTAQPLGMLAAYLLEPESDDGLTRWNFLDAYLKDGGTHPVSKIMGDVRASTKIVGQ